MKVAMIGHKRIPGREGGIEVVVEELSTRMSNNGINVTTYNRRKKGIKQIKNYKGVKIITVPTIEKKSTDALVYSFLASIHALFCNYDLIHYHGIGPSVMLLIPKIFGKKIIVTVHGLNYKTPKWKGLGAKMMRLGEKITAKYANQIIVLSTEQQKFIKNKYNRNAILIPNGVSIKPEKKANLIKQKWGLDEKKYILFLSRIVPGKGLEYLLDAYHNIDTDLPLVIAGGSEYVNEFYEMICNKVAKDNRVKMIGFVEGDILDELYTNAKLFVFPSEAEGMPMCLLEALSFNCPCLVSDIPENTEIGKDYVCTFKSRNTKDLEEKLSFCLTKHEEIFTRKSREYIISNYDWDVVTNTTIKEYENIINGGKA